MQVQPINNSDTSFRSLNSHGVNTPKAMSLLKKEAMKLEELAQKHEITITSEYIPFGFGDEVLFVSINNPAKKSIGLRKLFSNNNKLVPTSVEDCTSVVDLVNKAIVNSNNAQFENATYKMTLRNTDRKGTIRIYTPEQIARLKQESPSVPAD